MIQLEPKDLEYNKEYIVAFRKDEQWIPCKVKIIKRYTIHFVKPKNQINSPLEFNKEYSINDFWHECRGYDLYGNKFKMLWIFETLKIAEAWCQFEKEINNYIDEENLY